MKTILLVEDNIDDQSVILNMLEKNNVTNEVIVAADGETALSKLSGESGEGLVPDLIILDIALPGMDGLDVLKSIRSHAITLFVPVVVVSGVASPGEIARAYELGANSVILKPGKYGEFSEVMLNTAMYWLLINRTSTSQLVPSSC